MLWEEILGNVPAPDNIWQSSYAIAFNIGSLQVRWYAIFILFGFIVAIVLACLKMWKIYKISTEPFYWYILFGVPLAILGARFGSCAIGDANWASFFDFKSGGLAIEWGVALDVIAALIYFPLVLKTNRYRVRDEFGPTPQVRKVSFLLYFDAVMPAILIAQFIGRWGNYFNQELYGATVTNEWIANFLRTCLPWMYVGDSYKEPLFLWEGLINLAGFLLLFVGAEFIKVRKAGDLAAGYLLWYGVVRLCLEPLRDSQFKFMATFVMSGVFVAIGLGFIIINHCLCKKWRAYKIGACITHNIKWFFYNISQKSAIHSLQKQSIKVNDGAEHNKIVQQLNNAKLDYAKKNEEHKNVSFKRAEGEYLYYCRW